MSRILKTAAALLGAAAAAEAAGSAYLYRRTMLQDLVLSKLVQTSHNLQ